MFDIGFLELVLVAVVGLLVLGPERLPQAIRTGSLWLGKLRRNFNAIRSEIDRELNSDEIKRELHNQLILDSLESTKSEIDKGIENIQKPLGDTPYDISDVINAESEIVDTASDHDNKHEK